MTIIPIGDQILLEMETAKLGSLETSSMKTGMEWATIVALGNDAPKELKIKDKVFVKAWSIDVIQYEGEEYYFTSAERKGIVAIIK